MGKKNRILVVEDDKRILDLMHIALTEHGYQCRLSKNGEEALAILKADTDFIMVITDIVMPGINGIELTKELKKKFPDLPILVMTGYTDDFTYDNVINAGAADFIKKPFTIKELAVRVAKVKRDSDILAAIKRKEKEIKQMGSEMIAGVQEEAQKKIDKLQKEIKEMEKLIW